MRDNSLINRLNIDVFSVKVRSLAAREEEEKERMPALYFERHSFKKHIHYLNLSVNAHMNETNFHGFSKTLSDEWY